MHMFTFFEKNDNIFNNVFVIKLQSFSSQFEGKNFTFFYYKLLKGFGEFLRVVFTCTLFLKICQGAEDQLESVVVVFRHGDRTPVRPYITDPYANRSFWPVDWGMLTNLGKKQHYELGKYFRQRYSEFLPEIYSEKDIYVRSTDVDRTLMSAEANLAGLYPPVKSDIWEAALEWQPIPIHTIPEKLDSVLAAKKPCLKFDRLKKQVLKSEYFRNVSHQLHDLFAYLTKNTGQPITDLQNLEYLYSTLFIESGNNLTIPNWAKMVFPKKIQPWAALTFAVDTWTTELARLKTGPFFYELVKYFKNRTQINAQYRAPKFLMFSAHDTTISNLLNTMGAFEHHCPPYTATIMFELYRQPSGETYLKLFYKNSTEEQPIRLRGCSLECSLQKFEEVLRPVIVDKISWESECQTSWLDLPISLYWALGGVGLGILGIFFITLLAVLVAKKKSNSYVQLPDDDQYV